MIRRTEVQGEIRSQVRSDVRRVGWLGAWAAGCLLVFGCGGGGGGAKSESTIRFQLTTAQAVSGLQSVRLTAGSTARTVPIESLSAAATVLDLAIPANVTGTIEVSAIARPVTGCKGYGGQDV